jgi:antitoxin component of RelBE/YafQ-DinJ toxin-antitoxin module
MVQMRIAVEPELKAEVDSIAHNIGLKTADVTRVLLKRFAAEGGFPFTVDGYDECPICKAYNYTPNAKTMKAMKEVGRKVSWEELVAMQSNEE